MVFKGDAFFDGAEFDEKLYLNRSEFNKSILRIKMLTFLP
jgi:hypothetical protein